jgi:hypothetical protein
MSDNRQSRGADGFDDIDLDGEDLSKGPAAASGETSEESGGGDSEESTKLTVQVDPKIAQRIRSAVYYTPGLTMYQVIEKGIQVVVDHLEEQRGEPFPKFDGSLKGGRPPKGMKGPDL